MSWLAQTGFKRINCDSQFFLAAPFALSHQPPSKKFKLRFETTGLPCSTVENLSNLAQELMQPKQTLQAVYVFISAAPILDTCRHVDLWKTLPLFTTIVISSSRPRIGFERCLIFASLTLRGLELSSSPLFSLFVVMPGFRRMQHKRRITRITLSNDDTSRHISTVEPKSMSDW